MYHYVYLLINQQPIDERKYYIGVRTSNIPPEFDKYYSSSKIINKIIKSKGNVFKKIILKTFDSREKALEYEIIQHKKLNVKDNPKYYNLVNQTNLKFDTTGYIFIDGERISINDYHKSGKKYHSKNKITLIDKNGNYIHCNTNEKEELLKNGYSYLTKNLVYVLNNEGVYVPIYKKDYDKTIHQSSNYGKAPVVDSNGKRFLIDINSDDYLLGNVVSVHKNKTICVDSNGKTIYCTVDEMYDKGYVGINKGKINGVNNPNAKQINIYDDKNNLMFETYGDFKKICTENNLPLNPLARSYRNNGSKIFTNTKTTKYVLENNLGKFIGWYAIIIR